MKLIAISGKVPIKHRDMVIGEHVVGVLDTPCFPCQYYGGFIRQEDGIWIPYDNSTNNFHRTIEEAINHADKFLR